MSQMSLENPIARIEAAIQRLEKYFNEHCFSSLKHQLLDCREDYFQKILTFEKMVMAKRESPQTDANTIKINILEKEATPETIELLSGLERLIFKMSTKEDVGFKGDDPDKVQYCRTAYLENPETFSYDPKVQIFVHVMFSNVAVNSNIDMIPHSNEVRLQKMRSLLCGKSSGKFLQSFCNNTYLRKGIDEDLVESIEKNMRPLLHKALSMLTFLDRLQKAKDAFELSTNPDATQKVTLEATLADIRTDINKANKENYSQHRDNAFSRAVGEVLTAVFCLLIPRLIYCAWFYTQYEKLPHQMTKTERVAIDVDRKLSPPTRSN